MKKQSTHGLWNSLVFGPDAKLTSWKWNFLFSIPEHKLWRKRGSLVCVCLLSTHYYINSEWRHCYIRLCRRNYWQMLWFVNQVNVCFPFVETWLKGSELQLFHLIRFQQTLCALIPKAGGADFKQRHPRQKQINRAIFVKSISRYTTHYQSKICKQCFHRCNAERLMHEQKKKTSWRLKSINQNTSCSKHKVKITSFPNNFFHWNFKSIWHHLSSNATDPQSAHWVVKKVNTSQRTTQKRARIISRGRAMLRILICALSFRKHLSLHMQFFKVWPKATFRSLKTP